MISRYAASTLFAVGTAFATTCGVANAVPLPGEFPQVRYDVSGPAVAEFIVFQTDQGQQHATNVPLPWSTQFKSFGGQVFVLSAQGEGTIACKISLDGNVVNDAHSTGAPGHTVCSH